MSPVLGVIVSAALALGPAPPRLPDRVEDIAAHVRDLAAQKRYEALAVAARAAFERKDLAPRQHRSMGFFAVRGLHGVFEETGKVASLCDAQRLLRRIEREGVEDDAFAVGRLKKATAKHLASSGAQHPCSKPTKAKPPPRVAAAATSTPETAPEPTPRGDDDLVAVGGREFVLKEHVSHDMSKKADEKTVAESGVNTAPAEGPRLASDPPDQDERRRSPKLIRGGIALLSIGAAAGALFGVSLHFMGRTRGEFDGLVAASEQRGELTADEYIRAHRLDQDYQRFRFTAGVTGAVALAGIVGGMILFSVRPRRATTAATPWAGPTGAGLNIGGHF